MYLGLSLEVHPGANGWSDRGLHVGSPRGTNGPVPEPVRRTSVGSGALHHWLVHRLREFYFSFVPSQEYCQAAEIVVKLPPIATYAPRLKLSFTD